MAEDDDKSDDNKSDENNADDSKQSEDKQWDKLKEVVGEVVEDRLKKWKPESSMGSQRRTTRQPTLLEKILGMGQTSESESKK